jgi:hypothetical protein
LVQKGALAAMATAPFCSGVVYPPVLTAKTVLANRRQKRRKDEKEKGLGFLGDVTGDGGRDGITGV